MSQTGLSKVSFCFISWSQTGHSYRYWSYFKFTYDGFTNILAYHKSCDEKLSCWVLDKVPDWYLDSVYLHFFSITLDNEENIKMLLSYLKGREISYKPTRLSIENEFFTSILESWGSYVFRFYFLVDNLKDNFINVKFTYKVMNIVKNFLNKL